MMTDSDEEVEIELCKATTSGDGTGNFMPQNEFRFSASYLKSFPVVAAESNIAAAEEWVVADDVISLDEYHILRQQEKQLPVEQRPCLISVCCFKETAETPLGITFSSVNGVLKIRTINPKQPLAKSPLRPGDHMIALDNHRNCSQWTSTQAAQNVRDCVGHFSMLFSNPFGDPNVRQAVVYKADVTDRLGVMFHNDEQNRLRIKRLNNCALIGELCALQEGDFVESINGSSACHYMDTDVATTIIRSTPSLVSIIANPFNATEISVRCIDDNSSEPRFESFKTLGTVEATSHDFSSIIDVGYNKTIGNGILQPSPTEFDTFMEKQGIQPRYIYVCCGRPAVDTELGIVLQLTNEILQIKTMNRSGLLWASPLREGYEISSIDGRNTSNWKSLEAVVEYLNDRQNDISILARNPAGTCSYVVAYVTKPMPQSKIGVTFKKVGNGPLIIGSIQSTGLFSGSILNDGYEVVSINGVPARALSTTEARKIVQYATDSVTIRTRTDSATGIVLAFSRPGESLFGVAEGSMTNSTVVQQENGMGICACLCLVICVLFAFSPLYA
jgi:hypothetical protein